MTGSAAADLHNHVNRLHKYSDKLLLITCLKNTKTLTFPKCKVNTSLRPRRFSPSEREKRRQEIRLPFAGWVNTEKKCCFSGRESSCKLCREHTYRIYSNSLPSIYRLPWIIASPPPLSPSSLPFISSLSSWNAMRFSKTDQWRFKLWKLI